MRLIEGENFMNKLQRSVFPKIGMCTEKDLYFRLNNFAIINMSDSIIYLEKNGIVHTDTYFNSVSIGKWKKYTCIEDLNFNIKYKGKIKISWILHRLHYGMKILKEDYLESKSIEEKNIALDFWDDLEDGMLAFVIEASDESEIYDFSYFTNTEIKNKISLGISITHFNRQQYVLPAMARLKRELLTDKDFINKVSIFVVDNSKNLPQTEGITIVPNENLGGSGGFTRGLMELKERGKFTHCLFMDDDASCEVEGLKRTINVLEYAKDPELCIGGAMLREIEPFRQFENGARFDGICRPNKLGLDLRHVVDLLINEQEVPIDYAGWWFFAFPINKVKHYAFPYFVRGDDIGFGLVHKFKIITMNGISSWQEDFALKNGPLPFYLDTRNHIMQYFHGLVPNNGLIPTLKITARMLLRQLLTYQYETALASVCAIEDVNKGSSFWRNNVDMMKRRPEILSLVNKEKVIDVPFEVISQAKQYPSVTGEEGTNGPKDKLKNFLIRITLNGHLLPKIFFKKGIVAQNKSFGGILKEVYRYPKVLYIHQPTKKGYVVAHSKRSFFKCVFRYLKAITILTFKYRKLKKDYRATYNEFTSEEFWKKQFNRTGDNND